MMADRWGTFSPPLKVGCVCPKRAGRMIYCRLGNNNGVNNNNCYPKLGRSRRYSNRRKHLDQRGKEAFPFKNCVGTHMPCVSKNKGYNFKFQCPTSQYGHCGKKASVFYHHLVLQFNLHYPASYTEFGGL